MKNYYPVAEWAGRLILPDGKNNFRFYDGSVLFECVIAPADKSDLIGKILRLSIDPVSPWHTVSKKLSTDVAFDDETDKSIAEGENNHPRRLDGLKNVSPLESLAGAHDEDDVIVALEGVTVHLNSKLKFELMTTCEPVQISGFEKALVSFTDSRYADKGKVSARHFNPQTKDYTGEAEVFIIRPQTIFPKAKCLQSSLIDIEHEKQNTYGWYIYTRTDASGMKEITAIEPRSMVSIDASAFNQIHGYNKIKNFVSTDLWENFPHGVFRKHECIPADRRKNESEKVSFGDRFLVMHIFGWRGGENGDVLNEKQRITGHFALGTSHIIRCPFTGEMRFDTRYYQAYAHNRENIIAGTMMQHHFLGNVKRGWMFTVPITDAFFRMPDASASVDISGKNLLDYFELHLSKVTARMRVGYGNALSPVNASISCSQETAMAMVDACRSFRTEKSKGLSAEQKKNRAASMRVVKFFESFYRPFGITPPRWNKYFDGKSISSADWTGKNITINAALAWRSILPIVHFKGQF